MKISLVSAQVNYANAKTFQNTAKLKNIHKDQLILSFKGEEESDQTQEAQNDEASYQKSFWEKLADFFGGSGSSSTTTHTSDGEYTSYDHWNDTM